LPKQSQTGENLAIIDFVILALTSVIAVMEPFSTIAVYASLTRNFSAEKKRKTIARSMRISYIVLTFFALTGHLVFQVFNITIAAFQIAGGILLAVVALQMLNPDRMALSREDAQDVAIVPLAFPLTAGPGTITAVILLTSNAQDLLESFSVFVAIFIAILVSYVGLRLSHRLFKYLGDVGLRTITAIMAIIVLAIAVQFLINGVLSVIP
jgi:multiple antibiotic resistance protein